MTRRRRATTSHPSPETPTSWWKAAGPGIVAGAADDDPSGIATYSIAGAQFGTALLWTALLTWPLMAAVQSMCARIGMVTGRGLMAALRKKFSRPLLVGAACLLFIANTVNVGADLAGMADAAELLTSVNSHVLVMVFAVSIGWATIRFRYATIGSVMRWLALTLLVYIVTAFVVGPTWGPVLRATVVPQVPSTPGAWATLLAVLGTTISPYLFFWQASQEVEEEKAIGRRTVADRVGASNLEIRNRKIDVGAGTFAAIVTMYFIMLTTALTLHAHGLTSLTTSREVAQALEPLAGRFAALLYTLGLLGTGFLAIPTLTGSSAYAFAEIFGWRQGMDEQLRGAPAFYAVLSLSLAMGVLLDFLNISPVRALFYSAVLNGLLAPVLLFGILMVARDKTLMRGQTSSMIGQVTVGVAVLVMGAAAIAMFLT
ncbi:MAG: divalent metal cation transporter [Gemmatimonadaceae bacterium]